MDTVSIFFVELWWGLQALPWDTILAYLAASGLVTTVAQFLKKKLSIESKRKVLSLVSGLTVIPSFINYLASDQGQAWAAVLPKQFAIVFSGAVLMHAFLVSPVWNKLAKQFQPYLQAVHEVKAKQNPVVASAPTAPVVDAEASFDPRV